MLDSMGPDDAWSAMLQRARSGCSRSLGELLEQCRPYLNEIARDAIGARFRSKHGPSDLVQQSFLEAQRDFCSFQGTSDQELLGWLRQILQNNLLDFARRFHQTSKRDLSRECTDDFGNDVVAVPAKDPSPSQHASTREQILNLRSALEELPEEKRLVLRLRHQDQMSFVEIGRRIQKTEDAARKVWARAIEDLRRKIREGGNGIGKTESGSERGSVGPG